MIRYMLMISYICGQNSRHMNPFEIERGESFIIGDSDLRELLDRPYKSGYGMILFCYKGTANISVDLSRWDIRRNTVIVLIPDTILTLNASSEDFKVQYISFSKVLFDEAVFRLDPPFFRFIKDNPCYTHPADQEETINVIIRLFWLIYMDRDNVYRDMIVKTSCNASSLICMIRQGTPSRAASKMGATVGRSCSISSSIASMPIISTRKRSLSMRTSFVSLPVISPLSPGK